MSNKDTLFPLHDSIGYIELVDFSKSEKDIAKIATQSYLKANTELTNTQYNRIINKMLRSDPPHMSPFEFCNVTFKVKAPVSVWWQWVRHRNASYMFQSGRRTELIELYNPFANFNSEINDMLTASLELYKKIVAEGCRREVARSILPFYLMYYEAFVSMDMRSIINFIQQRSDTSAQYEIRLYANSMAKLLYKYFPVTMAYVNKE